MFRGVVNPLDVDVVHKIEFFVSNLDHRFVAMCRPRVVNNDIQMSELIDRRL